MNAEENIYETLFVGFTESHAIDKDRTVKVRDAGKAKLVKKLVQEAIIEKLRSRYNDKLAEAGIENPDSIVASLKDDMTAGAFGETFADPSHIGGMMEMGDEDDEDALSKDMSDKDDLTDPESSETSELDAILGTGEEGEEGDVGSSDMGDEDFEVGDSPIEKTDESLF